MTALEKFNRLNLPRTLKLLRSLAQDLDDEGDSIGAREIRRLADVVRTRLEEAKELPS